MKPLTLIIFIAIFNNGFIQAQNISDSSVFLIERLINNVNSLPRTNIAGKGEFKFQSQYTLEWKKKKHTLLTLIDKRYKPNSDEKLTDKYIIEFDIHNLHRNGVYVRSLGQDRNVNLQIFTANNEKNIKSSIYNNEKYVSSITQDRLTLGPWDSLAVINKLDTIKTLLVKIISLNTAWDERATPDINKTVIPEINIKSGSKYSSITYNQNDDSPLFLNSSIEEPALFSDAQSDIENKELINKYIIEQLNNKGINMKGILSGTVIISESGYVEDFKSFNMNKVKIEKEVKAIILSMPKWKAGKHKGHYVRTGCTILIKK